MKTLVAGLSLIFMVITVIPASAQWGGGYGNRHGGYGYNWNRGYHRDWYRPYNPYWRRHQRYWHRGW